MSRKKSTQYKAIILDTDKVLAESESLNRARTLNDRAISVLVEMAEYVRWGSRWSRSGEHVADTYDSIIRQLLIDTPPMRTETVREIVKYIQKTAPDILEEEVEDMSQRPQYQKFNGVWYAGFDCGDCGGVEWVPIGTGVELGTGGAPVTPEQNPMNITAPAPDNYDCYASASVDYLLNRYRQWLNFGLGTVTTALDESFAVFDDVVSVAAQFLSKSDERSIWDALIEQGEDELYAQVASERASYIANFNLEGRVTADSVQKLFTDELGTWSLPGQSIIMWIKTSKMLGITKDLANIAADCQANAGNSELAPLLPSVTPNPYFSQPVTSADTLYTTYTYNINQIMTCETAIEIPVTDNVPLTFDAVILYATGYTESGGVHSLEGVDPSGIWMSFDAENFVAHPALASYGALDDLEASGFIPRFTNISRDVTLPITLTQRCSAGETASYTLNRIDLIVKN